MNRRRTERLDFLVGGSLGKGVQPCEVLVHNLALKGCRVTCAREFELGDRVELSLNLEGLEEPLKVSCKVAWCHKVNQSESYQVGLVFTEFPRPEDFQRFSSFLAQEQVRKENLSGKTFSQTDATALSELDANTVQKIGALAKLSRFLNRSHDLQAVAESAVETIMTIMKAERVLVMLLSGGDEVEIVAAGGVSVVPPADDGRPQVAYSRSVVGKVLQEAAPVLSLDVGNDAFLQGSQSLVNLGTRSILCIPLSGRDRVIGVLYIDNALHSGAFSYGDLEVGRVLGELAGAAIERAQYFSMLIQNEKMSALGTLMASLAHELKNPLTAIQGVGDCLEGEADPELVEILKSQTLRCLDLVKGLTNWSHLDDERPDFVDFEKVLALTEPLVAPELQRMGITLSIHNEGDLPRVSANANSLSQVLVNLITNASASLVGRTDGQIHLRLCSSPDEFVIKVEDNGPGVPPEFTQRIFDPFFTTKPRGGGTGLGLSISKQILARYGGTLELRNLPFGGAQFTVTLPAAGPSSAL